ncbi:DNA-methyltransferase [Pelomonas sp. BJYL3]|uniref:DNA-methyltransferase n=1 Tax=Pelomonas sp. BJYL3 TaxID=2976697 RepID=UPI0022B2C1F1|nr:DNA methyltransferase [Pelomonas sp. BJYL3]
MTTKVTIGPATLYLGDALDILPRLEPGIAALITDPPYSSGGMTRGDRMQGTASKYVSTGATRAAHNVEFMGDNRDQRSWQFWMSLWLTLAQSKLKPGAYALCFTDWRQLPALTDVFQAGGLVWRGLVPWDKTESSRAPHTGYFRHQCEYVVWGSNGPLPAAEHGGPWPGLVRERVNHRTKLHMTGKPVELMERLVACADPGGVILDPFMGSASTGVAALKKGRQFVGIEKSPHYFDVACKRIELLLSEEAMKAAT